MMMFKFFWILKFFQKNGNPTIITAIIKSLSYIVVPVVHKPRSEKLSSTNIIRSIMKDVVLASPDLPNSIKGGPWALDDGDGKRSFVLNVGGIRSSDVNSWINM